MLFILFTFFQYIYKFILPTFAEKENHCSTRVGIHIIYIARCHRGRTFVLLLVPCLYLIICLSFKSVYSGAIFITSYNKSHYTQHYHSKIIASYQVFDERLIKILLYSGAIFIATKIPLYSALPSTVILLLLYQSLVDPTM